MTPARQYALVLRWTAVVSVAIALFWSLWWIIVGSVPVTTSIELYREQTGTPAIWQLPISVSHWWDIPAGAIWTAMLVNFLAWWQMKPVRSVAEDEGILDLTMGERLVAGLLLGLILGLALGLCYSLVTGEIALGLILGVAGGLGLGVVFGLFLGLAARPVLGLVAVLNPVLRSVVRLPVWRALGDWLLARERR